VVELVAATVADALAHQKQSDRVQGAFHAGLNAVNTAVNQIAAATVSASTAAIPAQLAIPMGRNLDKDATTREGARAAMQTCPQIDQQPLARTAPYPQYQQF
jgi:hypothetical protein